MKVPRYLAEYGDLFEEDQREAALAWFRDAKYGLFLHYGVYSLLGRGEWVMLNEKIPVGEYEKLADRFTAEHFDADMITDLAAAVGMRYVNITARHHDSFCLFKTGETDFSAAKAPAGRDLVGELAKACAKRGLGLFLYYSYALDWRHPYFFSREEGVGFARPAYEEPEPSYLYRTEEDFHKYIDFAHAQIKELLTQYGPLAGLWFDPIMPYYQRADLFPIEETYALVRELQPACLISFKQGANGAEDFASCERSARSLKDRLTGDAALRAERAWQMNRHKHNEICDTMQPRSWGYDASAREHRSADEVLAMLAYAESVDCNLLLNTGPVGDGSIDTTDERVLREVGRRLAG